METAQMIVDDLLKKTDRDACRKSGKWFFFNSLIPLNERPKEGALSDVQLADVGLVRYQRGAWRYAAEKMEERLKAKEREVKQKDLQITDLQEQITDLQEQLRKARGSAKRGHDEDTAEFLADSPVQQKARQ